MMGAGAGPAGTISSWQHCTDRACSPFHSRHQEPLPISDRPRLGLSSLALLQCPSRGGPLLAPPNLFSHHTRTEACISRAR